MEEIHSILIRALAIFLLIDPVGNVPFFVTFLKKIPPKKQALIVLRELVLALILILAFYFAGGYILRTFEVETETMQLSGGIILFLMALNMLNSTYKAEEPKVVQTESTQHIPVLVPLAIPLTAGPSVLAAVIIYSQQSGSILAGIASIVIAWVVSALILALAPFIGKFLGPKSLTSIERPMGIILIFIAVQMFVQGLIGYLHHISDFAKYLHDYN